MSAPDVSNPGPAARAAWVDKLVGSVKGRLDRLPPSLRFASFVIFRGVARIALPRYRRSAEIYSVIGQGKLIVSGGPFTGLKYIACATGSTTMPKLLGTYELELHDAVDSLLKMNPDLVVDVGSAEGYYAVGVADRLPQAQVVCYDINDYAHYLLNRLARLNGVQNRVIQKERCDPRELETILAPSRRPALIMDVDGPEDQLLRPDLTPTLLRTFIILELHDFLNPGVSARISERFRATHEIITIDSRPRTFADLPAGIQLPAPDALEAMAEAREGPQQWFVMTPKAQHS